MEKYLQQTGKETVKSWINSTLKNYLKNNPENIGEIEHIIDYLNSNKAPENIKGLQYENAKKNAKKWVESLAKKGRNIVETESDVEIVKELKNGFKLVKLVEKSAYEREGALMSHCVSSYYDNSRSQIYSLRDPQNKPHCTIEITSDGKNIQQIKGKGNGSIHPKYIQHVIDILQYFDINVRASELRNLGYLQVSDSVLAFLTSNLENIKYMTFQDSLFVYENSLK